MVLQAGKPAEAWTSRPTLESEPTLKPMLERWDQSLKSDDPEKAKANFEKLTAAWPAAVEKAKAAGTPEPKKPVQPAPPDASPNRPSNLYNGMIAPLLPLSIRGAIWYQGESNVSRAFQYRTLFPKMIQGWRKEFAQGDFPFYFVQIAPFNYGGKNAEADPAPCAELWALARDYGKKATIYSGPMNSPALPRRHSDQ